MDSDNRHEHLSHIETLWSVVKKAHAEDAQTQAGQAQARLIERYGPAIHRYLLGALRDADLADEMFQEFALRLVRGDFRNADPARGRFRFFLKTALYHLVVDAQRRRHRAPGPLPSGIDPPAREATPEEADAQFVEAWRAELMARTWDALQQSDSEGRHLYLVLRYRRDHPDVRSPDMAEQLAPLIGKAVTPEWVRKRLHLARERFADLLLQEVARTLTEPTREQLEDELLGLGLLNYCQSALVRWQSP